MEEIKSLSLAEIIKQVTSIADDDIQNQVFEWKEGDPCAQPLQLNASNLEHCPYLKGYDYFQVSFFFQKTYHNFAQRLKLSLKMSYFLSERSELKIRDFKKRKKLFKKYLGVLS